MHFHAWVHFHLFLVISVVMKLKGLTGAVVIATFIIMVNINSDQYNIYSVFGVSPQGTVLDMTFILATTGVGILYGVTIMMLAASATSLKTSAVYVSFLSIIVGIAYPAAGRMPLCRITS